MEHTSSSTLCSNATFDGRGSILLENYGVSRYDGMPDVILNRIVWMALMWCQSLTDANRSQEALF